MPVESDGIGLALNTSSVLAHLPLLQQPAAAAAAGFDEIELWWPYRGPEATRREADELVAAVEEAGVRVGLLNFYGGDLSRGERGFTCQPGREDEFAAAMDGALRLGKRLGVRAFNPMYGLAIAGVSPDEQERTGVANLALAAGKAGEIGARVALEPLSGIPSYPLTTAAATMRIVEKVRETGSAAIGMLADFYHLSHSDEDLIDVIRRYARDFVRVQIADAPGRGHPGSGELPLGTWLGAAREAGYDGPVGLEYFPEDPAVALGWLA
ncbi:hydroxypyruvate isomerase family protein [Sinomonas terrae]|uniref:TIM barrel protein n=1 Tax=Sinomonas terrae TaxID=2908838 RepID=A0ABS9U5Z4_9MICC|nr:TIM barrel protein [Sinomonas terrae]MCH6471956.1 TIM barrel protein [Sinomonas terrae]